MRIGVHSSDVFLFLEDFVIFSGSGKFNVLGLDRRYGSPLDAPQVLGPLVAIRNGDNSRVFGGISGRKINVQCFGKQV